MNRKGLLYLFLIITCSSRAQEADVIKNYIETYKDLAITEMNRTGVPAAITLAQGIHESGAGRSKLALASNNHFGIKCKTGWTGESVKHDDDGKGECFRKYPTVEDSYKDHSDFLRNGQRYASLFSLDPADYDGWANGLKNAGYATNPRYPRVLIKLIEDYKLHDYTNIGLGQMPGGSFTAGNTSLPVSRPKDTDTIILNKESSLPEEKPETKTVYPAGIFRINETKVVYIKNGTSFLAIAKQYDIDLSRIFEFNEIPPAEETEKDQLIFLQRKRKTGNHKFHIVLPAETLHDIAQKEGIRLENLLQLNNLAVNDQPAVKERLNLQGKPVSPSKPALKETNSGNRGNANPGTH